MIGFDRPRVPPEWRLTDAYDRHEVIAQRGTRAHAIPAALLDMDKAALREWLEALMVARLGARRDMPFIPPITEPPPAPPACFWLGGEG